MPKISQVGYGESCETIATETVYQGFQNLSTVFGPVLAALLEFDDIGPDQPIAPIQHLVDCLSGAGLGVGVNPVDGMGKLVEIHETSSGMFSASSAL